MKKSLLMCLFLMASLLNAQVNAYRFSQSNGIYTEITAGTIIATPTANSSTGSLDSNVYHITLPYDFYFNGEPYRSLYISTNGFVTFGDTAPSTTSTSPISSRTSYKGAISAWGGDLNTVFNISGTTGNISWKTIGTYPNREVVIQWKDFRPAYSVSETNVYVFSFQIKLKETSNVISIVYKNGGYLTGTEPVFGSRQIGLRGDNNLDYHNKIGSNVKESVSSGSEKSNMTSPFYTISNTTSGMPANGLTYRWSPPNCIAPTDLSISNITINSAEISWKAPVINPLNGYEYYYSTDNKVPTSSTIPLGTSLTKSAFLENLNSATPYYIWVRSSSGISDKSVWSSLGTFTTLCAERTSMYENFDDYATGSGVPLYWDRISGIGSQKISATSPASGTRNMYQSASASQNPTIVVLPILSNINAGTHWLRFKARVSSGMGALDVGYVTNIGDPDTFVNLSTVNIENRSYFDPDAEYIVTVPKTVPSNARLAIKNNADSKSYYWDDVYWEQASSCFIPTKVKVSNVTSYGADISWAALGNVPTNGYEYYYSTKRTTPSSSTIASGNSFSKSVTLGNLSSATTYYVWIRSHCKENELSSWSSAFAFTTNCESSSIISSTEAKICPGSQATLSAIANSDTVIRWYDSQVGGQLLGTGSTFVTPSITNTTTYYAEAANEKFISVGPLSAMAQGGRITTQSSSIPWAVYFTVLSQTKFSSVDIFPISSGEAGGIKIFKGTSLSEKPLAEVPFTTNVGGGATAQTINLNIELPPGNYTIYPKLPSSGLKRNASGAVYPYTSKVANITGNGFDPTYFMSFYNWKFDGGCVSKRQAITATVDCSSSDITKKEVINLYPNPFVNVVNITDISKVKSIIINDASGKQVKVINSPSSVLNLEELNSGMYLVVLELNDKTTQTVKIIKK
ncbi:fibronectin type III domain-containing protein [Chryseobacterium fistulae]|uniref:Fibronectin type-III domain-containing protein n=1 Tax=Chryseobacterium fistulae TaxID=2675058 RepID=A0A6N4XYU9_9FLAO|nr:fibronectin type III domain-containing protein [Chryseobacterium fistulae]CAA7392569.1 hypothetical protein CHRY9393_03290 [Chryseobacterium fistulae]